MNAPFAYLGGKSKLAGQIVSLIPAHKTYAEVFGGAAWVFFRKPPSKYEIINDLDGDLVNFWRVVKYHPRALDDELAGILSSREVFADFKAQLTGPGLTDIQRAARYYRPDN